MSQFIGFYVVLTDGVGHCESLIEGPTRLWMRLKFDDESVEFHDAEELFDSADFYATRAAADAAFSLLVEQEAPRG